MEIEKLLLKFNSNKLPANFVSLVVQIKNGEAKHAGILVRHLDINYLHHFPGFSPPTVEIFTEEQLENDEWYVYKIIDSFDTEDPNEVGAFLQYCKRVCEKSKIMYGFISDGSSYNTSDGSYQNQTSLPEFGTCVGFCVNTLTNALIDVVDQYFNLEDWDDSEVIDWLDTYSREKAEDKYPDLNLPLYNAYKKRIKPIEYITSSFLSNYPIKKQDIIKIQPHVENAISKILQS